MKEGRSEHGAGGGGGGHVAVAMQQEANKLTKTSPLSESLWKMSNDTQYSIGDVSARLAWKDLTVQVVSKLRGRGPHTVLHGLTGYAEPGQLMAIMGPSGSGKSTLLDTLAGRLAANAKQTGTVLLNGRQRKLCYGTAAYVTQDDSLIGTLTVRESIRYSAKLRLPDRMGQREKVAIVESVINEMGLQECADTYVGNWHLRGISGGEKRRVSIAIEILMRPRLLFLDEPTSGLDSASAFFVIQTVRSLARDGRTVIASVHQPSSEVFELFDNLFLLSGGHTVYFGDASEACNFFESAGFPCPALRNPSDHFLRCINSDFDRVKATIRGSFRIREHESFDPLDKVTTAHVISVLLQAYETSEYAMQANAKFHELSQSEGTVLESSGTQASLWMQMATLTRRSFTNMSRDVGYYWLRVIIYMVVSLCVGTIYHNVGTSFGAIKARGGAAAFVFGFITFMSIGGFPSFVEDMKVFLRERMNGHYGVFAFVMGNSLSSMPFLLLISLLSSTICYFLVGLHPGFLYFFYFTLTLYASVMVVESLMMLIASLVPNFLMGIVTGAGIQGIFMLVAGYFRMPNDIPKPIWRYPMSYLSFDYWALQGQFKNDFLGMEFDNDVSAFPPKIPGKLILEQYYQISTRMSKWIDLAMVVVMVIMYRLLFFGVIKVKESAIPQVRAKLTQRSLQKAASIHEPPSPVPPPSPIKALRRM